MPSVRLQYQCTYHVHSMIHLVKQLKFANLNAGIMGTYGSVHTMSTSADTKKGKEINEQKRYVRI